MKDSELIKLREENARLRKEIEWLREENDSLKQLNGTLTTGLLQLPDYDQAIFSAAEDTQNKFVDLLGEHLAENEAHRAFTHMAVDTVNVLSSEVTSKEEKIIKYCKGTQDRAAEKLEKWRVVYGFFLEEIQKGTKLNEAREAAATRAGFRPVPTERTLIRELPDPKKISWEEHIKRKNVRTNKRRTKT